MPNHTQMAASNQHARKHAPHPKLPTNRSESSLSTKLTGFVFGREYFGVLLALMILFEVILTLLIIYKVPYTEIDWVAYMQEVQGFLNGDTNYLNLKGDTGPLVYPAGFVYIFSALYYLTGYGHDILRAQYIFYGLYLIMTILTAVILHKSKLVPNWAIVLIIFSKRIHSIFVLRCFNDPIAMLFLYAAVLCFIKDHWKLGSVFFSLGVSVKMNVLLFAPGLLVLYLQRCGILGTFVNLTLCAAIQILLGLPFLLTYPQEYIGRAFEFGRVFTFKWSVNLKFLSEDVFVGKPLAHALLLAHLSVLVIYYARRESVHPKGLFGAIKDALTTLGPRAQNLSPEWIVSGLYVSNFIGIVFARSLHHQFYVWYFHTLPVLISLTSLPFIIKVACMAGIEYAFNVYPTVPYSSVVLVVAHMVLLLGILSGPRLTEPSLHAHVDGNKKNKIKVKEV